MWPSHITGASRRLARRIFARRRACAAASSAISVSALDSTTISPGVWARSIAAEPSAIVPGSVASRCIQPPDVSSAAAYRDAVEALAADHDEPGLARLARAPGPVEMLLHAVADRLHDLRRSRPGTSRKPLTRNTSCTRIARPAGRGTAGSATGPRVTTKLSKSSWSCSASSSWTEGRAARSSSAAAARPSATSAGTLPSRATTSLTPAAAAPRSRRAAPAERGGIDQIGLVENDEIGAGELVGEHLLERVVVIERRVRRALQRDGLGIGGETAAATAAPSITASTPSTVMRVRISGQAKACTSGFGNARPEVSIEDVLGRLGAVEQPGHGRQEIVGDGAAQAAIGELDDVLLGAGGVAAAEQHLAVDAELAELVDDDGEPPPVGAVRQQMPHEARLAGAEEAGDDCRGNRAASAQPSFNTNGSPAATKTTRSASAAISWLSRPAASRNCAAERCLRHEAHADLVADQHDRSGRFAQGPAQPPDPLIRPRAGKQQVRQPQGQQSTSNGRSGAASVAIASREGQRTSTVRQNGAAPRAMRGDAFGHLDVAGFGGRAIVPRGGGRSTSRSA